MRDDIEVREGETTDIGEFRVEPPVESEAPLRVLATSLSHVELRPYTWDMVDALTQAANDERIPRYMGDQFTHPYTTDDAETWIEMATKSR